MNAKNNNSVVRYARFCLAGVHHLLLPLIRLFLPPHPSPPSKGEIRIKKARVINVRRSRKEPMLGTPMYTYIYIFSDLQRNTHSCDIYTHIYRYACHVSAYTYVKVRRVPRRTRAHRDV